MVSQQNNLMLKTTGYGDGQCIIWREALMMRRAAYAAGCRDERAHDRFWQEERILQRAFDAHAGKSSHESDDILRAAAK